MAPPPRPLQTSKSKRHLSTPSSPSSHEEQKIKSNTSKNRFAPLAKATDGEIENEVFQPNDNITVCEQLPKTKITHTPTRIPAIYIKNVTNFSLFSKKIISLTGTNDISFKSTPSFLIIRPNNRINYNIVIDYLKETDAEFHSFRPHCKRQYKAVIRNLHHSTIITDITNALAELGHSATRVVNIKKSHRPLPLFHVELASKDNNKDIFKIKKLLHSTVLIEKPHTKRKNPPQCYTCQAYGHTRNYCSQQPRCVKCGDNHSTDMCTKDSSLPAKCALFSGAHTASYKGCIIHKKLTKSTNKPKKAEIPKQQGTSRRHASHSPPSAPSYASVTAGQPISNTTDSTSNIVNELNKLLNPLISLITVILSKLTKIFP